MTIKLKLAPTCFRYYVWAQDDTEQETRLLSGSMETAMENYEGRLIKALPHELLFNEQINQLAAQDKHDREAVARVRDSNPVLFNGIKNFICERDPYKKHFRKAYKKFLWTKVHDGKFYDFIYNNWIVKDTFNSLVETLYEKGSFALSWQFRNNYDKATTYLTFITDAVKTALGITNKNYFDLYHKAKIRAAVHFLYVYNAIDKNHGTGNDWTYRNYQVWNMKYTCELLKEHPANKQNKEFAFAIINDMRFKRDACNMIRRIAREQHLDLQSRGIARDMGETVQPGNRKRKVE